MADTEDISSVTPEPTRGLDEDAATTKIGFAQRAPSLESRISIFERGS
jgi:hypothetical protein